MSFSLEILLKRFPLLQETNKVRCTVFSLGIVAIGGKIPLNWSCSSMHILSLHKSYISSEWEIRWVLSLKEFYGPVFTFNLLFLFLFLIKYFHFILVLSFFSLIHTCCGFPSELRINFPMRYLIHRLLENHNWMGMVTFGKLLLRRFFDNSHQLT